MTTETDPGKAGPLFEDFLKEQGTYDETTANALTRVEAFRSVARGVK